MATRWKTAPIGTYGLDPTLNRSQVDQMQVNLQRQELDFLKQKYADVLGMYRQAMSSYGQGGGAYVPPEYGQMVSLYQPGGQYGQGTEQAISRGAQQEIAAGNVAQAATGMSSGTTALARTSAAIRNATLQRRLANERRLELLGGAYAQAGQAGLTAQEIDAMRQRSLLGTLAALS